MEIAIYSRDDQGLVTYVGSHWWPSLQDLLVYYFREDDQPEHDILVGWPHKYVTWYRGLGIGSHSAPTPPSPKVQGTDSVAAAVNSGDATFKGENDYTIHISGERGHFEKGGEAIGGLWFDDHTLIDHDGTFFLPKSVAKALRDAGYHVSEDFI